MDQVHYDLNINKVRKPKEGKTNDINKKSNEKIDFINDNFNNIDYQKFIKSEFSLLLDKIDKKLENMYLTDNVGNKGKNISAFSCYWKN